MSSSSPHSTLFEVFGRSETAAIPEINRTAVDTLVSILAPASNGEPDTGKVVLLKSPRAGYGKTLLLQAVKRQIGGGTRFLAVEPSGGGRIDGEVVLDSVLRQLSVVLPASGGLTEFDFFARHLLAAGLRPLLVSGEIPSHDREGALFAIENRPIETFDFHHQQAATAHWTQANFEVLGPRLAAELSEISQCGLRDCAYWMDLLFKYATTAPEKVERTRYLTEAVLGDLQGLGRSAAEERLQSLLTLLALVQPVVLVFDETEGLSNRPEMGLKVAAFVAQLRQACPGLAIVFSLNEDVWESGLAPLMPGGLKDRLTEYVVELQPMERSEAKTLLANRFGGNVDRVLETMKWPEPLYARAVVKEGLSAARQLEPETVSPSQEEKVTAVPPPLSSVFETESSDERDKEVVLKPAEAQSPFESQPPATSPSPVSSESVESAPVNPFEMSSEDTSPDSAFGSKGDGKSEQSSSDVDSSSSALLASPFEVMEPKESETRNRHESPFMIVSESPAEARSPFESTSHSSADDRKKEQKSTFEDEDFAGAPSNPFLSSEEEVSHSQAVGSKPEKSPFEAVDSSSPTTSQDNTFAPQPTNPFGAGVGQEAPKPAASSFDPTPPPSPFEKGPETQAPQEQVHGGGASDDFAAPAGGRTSPANAPEKQEAASPVSPFQPSTPEKSHAEPVPNPFGAEKESPFSSSQASREPLSNAPAVAPPSPFSPSGQSPFDAPSSAPQTPATDLEPSPPSQSATERTGAPSVREESEEVENLLNQFKKRFGRPGGSS
jgi:hypothetical protein